VKRLLIVSLGMGVLALSGAPATATGQPAGADSITGATSDCLNIPPGETFCDRTFLFDVDVESGAAGENPTGTVSWYDAGPTPGASSTGTTTASCLSVSGGVATIGVTGSWERFGVSAAVFPIAGLVRVVDTGGPDSGEDTIQFAIQTGPQAGLPLPGPRSCSTFPGTFPTGNYPFPDATNEIGDIVVADTRPLPTTKDQCKKNGWRTYGVFKNQGNCISLVATGGENPPASSDL
jgi:hypothetical protein